MRRCSPQKGEPRKQLGADIARAAGRAWPNCDAALHQQSAHDEHLRMVRLRACCWTSTPPTSAQRGLADMADLERCALALLRDATLVGLGPGAARRADAPCADRRVPGHQPAAVARAACVAVGAMPGRAAVRADSGRRASSSSATRSKASTASGAPSRASSMRRATSSREGLDGDALACDHTRRNAPEVLDAINAVFEAAAVEPRIHRLPPHTTEIAATPSAGVSTLPRVSRPRSARRARRRIGPIGLARQPDARRAIEPEEMLREPEARQVAAAVAALAGTCGLHARRNPRPLPQARVAAAGRATSWPRFMCRSPRPRTTRCSMAAPRRATWSRVLDVLASPQHRAVAGAGVAQPVVRRQRRRPGALAAAPASGGDWWRALMQGALAQPSRCSARPHAAAAAGAARRRRLPPHDLLDRIVAEGEVRERVAAAVPPERRQAALGCDRRAARRGADARRRPLRHAVQLRAGAAAARGQVAAPAQRDAVQLLTIHGAKGLEARRGVPDGCRSRAAERRDRRRC